MSEFTIAGGDGFSGGYLGWRPVVLAQAAGQNVHAGQQVPARRCPA